MHTSSFPISRRVRRRRDFLAIYAGNNKLHTRHFFIFYIVQLGMPQRAGFAVSRKIGNAVVRNRIKRLLRELFRTLPFCLPGFQIAVAAKNGADALRFSNVRDELYPIIRKLAGCEK